MKVTLLGGTIREIRGKITGPVLEAGAEPQEGLRPQGCGSLPEAHARAPSGGADGLRAALLSVRRAK